MPFLRRLVVIIGIATFVVATNATSAFAHTNFVSSDPADGSALANAPTIITLNFSEEPSAKFLVIELKNAAGMVVNPATIDVNKGRVTIGLPKLLDDTYRLKYRVRDPIDLHLTAGSIVFGIGQSPSLASQAAETGSANVSDTITKLLERLALVALVGSVFVAFALRVEPAKALRIAAFAGIALAAAQVALIVNETIDVGGGLGTLGRVSWSSSFGRRSLIAMQLGVGTALLARLVGRIKLFDRRDTLVKALFGLAALCVVAVGYSGHASVGGNAFVGVTLRFVHLAALSMWLGGLGVLLVLRASRPSWARFAPWAFGCATAVVASGFALSSREVASATALDRTTFGRYLLVKLVVVIVAVTIAVVNHRKVRRTGSVGLAGGRSEATAMVIAVAFGALLASTPPAVGVQFDKQPKPVPSVQTIQVDDLVVTVSISPNRPGKNIVSTSVVTTRRPSPGKIDAIKVTVSPLGQTPTVLAQADTSSLSMSDDGTVQLASAGALKVVVDVARPARPAKPVTFDWAVNPTPIARPAKFISDEPLAGLAWVLTGLVLVAGLIVGVLWRRRLFVGNAVGS